jgi:hemoglobin-like flavoprotein
MVVQGTKLTARMSLLVAALEQPATPFVAAAALGQRHAGYDVTQRHYDLGGEALLATIEDVQRASRVRVRDL